MAAVTLLVCLLVVVLCPSIVAGEVWLGNVVVCFDTGSLIVTGSVILERGKLQRSSELKIRA